MADPPVGDSLAARRDLVIVVNVVVGLDGQVIYGALIDPDTGHEVAFAGSASLPAALDDWVGEALKRSSPQSGPHRMHTTKEETSTVKRRGSIRMPGLTDA